MHLRDGQSLRTSAGIGSRRIGDGGREGALHRTRTQRPLLACRSARRVTQRVCRNDVAGLFRPPTHEHAGGAVHGLSRGNGRRGRIAGAHRRLSSRRIGTGRRLLGGQRPGHRLRGRDGHGGG
jgi:hypothetical protein